MKARPGPRPLRSKRSPNSSSISRRIRSKLAKRSRSGGRGEMLRLEGQDDGEAYPQQYAARDQNQGEALARVLPLPSPAPDVAKTEARASEQREADPAPPPPPPAPKGAKNQARASEQREADPEQRVGPLDGRLAQLRHHARGCEGDGERSQAGAPPREVGPLHGEAGAAPRIVAHTAVTLTLPHALFA